MGLEEENVDEVDLLGVSVSLKLLTNSGSDRGNGHGHVVHGLDLGRLFCPLLAHLSTIESNVPRETLSIAVLSSRGVDCCLGRSWSNVQLGAIRGRKKGLDASHPPNWPLFPKSATR